VVSTGKVKRINSGCAAQSKVHSVVMQWIFGIGASLKFEFGDSDKNDYKMQSKSKTETMTLL